MRKPYTGLNTPERCSWSPPQPHHHHVHRPPGSPSGIRPNSVSSLALRAVIRAQHVSVDAIRARRRLRLQPTLAPRLKLPERIEVRRRPLARMENFAEHAAITRAPAVPATLSRQVHRAVEVAARVQDTSGASSAANRPFRLQQGGAARSRSPRRTSVPHIASLRGTPCRQMVT